VIGKLITTDNDKSFLSRLGFSALSGVVKTGGFRYDDGTRYIGDWNQKGQKHGMGHMLLTDGTRYGTLFLILFAT
jgi:hypothetical protein